MNRMKPNFASNTFCLDKEGKSKELQNVLQLYIKRNSFVLTYAVSLMESCSRLALSNQGCGIIKVKYMTTLKMLCKETPEPA